ncbi:MAG TPA: DUF6758 family protein [Nocardioides sp.]|uniref:DUF6758 family protein n=1 Tax=Nocardioides sp. TaxID=35761 RepID=UPI002EDA6595
MGRIPGCPRCATPVAGAGGAWSCPEHGPVPPLWHAEEASYDGFVAHLERTAGFPTYLPWPLSPGWHVTDFAAVGGDRPAATMTCVSGPSELDGPVDLLVVAEEPGTGLGARCAGMPHADPGHDLADGPATLRLRLDAQQVSLWPVSTSRSHGEWDRSVLAGEGGGRWLWLVLRPASALLLLHEEWTLRDVSRLGPALLDLPFGGPAPAW